MYRLLRAEGLEHRPALLGALAFEAIPKLFAHYGAGHLTLLYAKRDSMQDSLLAKSESRAKVLYDFVHTDDFIAHRHA